VNREAYTYDALDYVLTYTDGENRTTTYERDAWGNALSERDPKGVMTYYTFDRVGNCTSIKDGNNSITNFTYNSLNQIGVISDGLNQTTHYAYDILGRMTEETDRNGNTIRYTYTGDDTLKSQKNIATNDYTQYYYRKDGLLLAAANNDGIDTFDYDQNGRVTVKNHNGKTTAEYTYNADGQVTSLKDITGQATQYMYAKTGLLEKIYDSDTLLASYVYDKDYRLTDINFVNGQSQHYSYDGDGNITGLNSNDNSGTVIDEYQYTYDNNDNVLTMVQNGQMTTYTYDGLNRLKTANYQGIGQETFDYDNAGNRITRTLGADNETYTYDANNRLTGITGSKAASFDYDANGNLTQERVNGQTTTYTYNGFNQLKNVELPDSNVQTMGYDAFGVRTYTVYQNQKTQYLTSAGKVITSLDYVGDVEARYVWGIDLLTQVQNESTYYYHHNAHSDVTQILNDQGTVVNSYTYDAFGNTLTAIEGINNVFQYAGEQYDETLGKYYLRARYYDPAYGRFTQEDTYRGDGNNLYAYVRSNPLNYVDPTGHMSEGKQCYNNLESTSIEGIWPTLGDIGDSIQNGLNVLTSAMSGINAGILEVVSFGTSRQLDQYNPRTDETAYTLGKVVGNLYVGALSGVKAGGEGFLAVSTAGTVAGPVVFGTLASADAVIAVDATLNAGANILTLFSGDKGTGEDEAAPNLDKVDDKYLKQKGVDAHELKKDVYGRKAKVAEYDIYVDKETGQLYTQRKPQFNKRGEPAIPTGEYIK
jgi:RHS repeat-associated protein